MHYRKLFEETYVGHWDLDGKDAIPVTIREVVKEDIYNRQERRNLPQPVIYFEAAKKGMVLNKTNAKTIAAAHGENIEDWNGKPIEIYADTTMVGGELVGCVRVRVPS